MLFPRVIESASSTSLHPLRLLFSLLATPLRRCKPTAPHLVHPAPSPLPPSLSSSSARSPTTRRLHSIPRYSLSQHPPARHIVPLHPSAFLSVIDMSWTSEALLENRQRMERGELYTAFVPDLTAERRKAAQACSRYNAKATLEETSRREQVEMLRVCVPPSLQPAGETAERLFPAG
jgi:hypothetical protein